MEMFNGANAFHSFQNHRIDRICNRDDSKRGEKISKMNVSYNA